MRVFFIYSGCNLLSDTYSGCKGFSLCGLSFYSFNSVLWREGFNVSNSNSLICSCLEYPFSSRSFIILGFTVSCLIYFNFYMQYEVWVHLFFFFWCMWLLNCFSTNCWNNYPFSIKLYFLFCKNFPYMCKCFSALFTHSFIYLYVNATLFWLLQLYNC